MAQVKVGGAWRTVSVPYTRIAGTWRPCKQIYTKVGGVWKIAFDITLADEFSTAGDLSTSLTPGYAPWQVLSGTWTKASGEVNANDSANRIAALDVGTENVEVEIDRSSPATGGTGVAFWIQDQSNWWGVRAYTEEYFVPFSFNVFYAFTCTDTYFNRNFTYNPPGSIPGNYVSCYYVATQSNNTRTANTNRFTSANIQRTCSCSGNTNGNCSFSFTRLSFSTCPSGGACSTNAYPNQNPCTLNNRGIETRTDQCPGAACGNCTPVSSFCVPANSFIGNSTNCPSPTVFTASSPQCTCFYPTNYANFPNFNSPTPVPASCSCTDSFSFSSTFNTNTSTNFSAPSCSPFPPCLSPFSFSTRSCSPCTSGCTQTVNGANAAYFKRGQIIRRNAGGSIAVITNQDFGDVGNLYAYTSGNVIGFRQYSSTGRGGSASNLVTYDAGSVPKGTRHGILVTAVPYTQTFSISRFKVNV
jgi:hypothetical protein